MGEVTHFTEINTSTSNRRRYRLLKIAVTILIVTGLSIVAERVNPRTAGILSGYPAGSAISLFFIGLELGADFGGQSALYNVAGLTALLFFLLIYYQVSIRVKRMPILAASAVAVVGFLAVVSLLFALQMPPWAGILITAGAIPLFLFLFRAIPNAVIAQRVHLGPRVLLFRAALSALVIVIITGAAHLVGPKLAGLFSAFPATVYPLLLIIHLTYGSSQAHTILKNVPKGLGSLVFYSITISFAYPALGIYWGTLIGLVVASVYLLMLAGLEHKLSKEKIRQIPSVGQSTAAGSRR
jgi:hypothetical protein